MNKGNNMKKPKAKKDNIVVKQIGDETLVYDLKANKAFCLNYTSAMIWQLSDGTRRVEDIETEMSVRLKTLVGEDFVYFALNQLSNDGLLEGQIENHFAGLSRREVIRKVGFASAIALPLISSIIAPTALMAQSVCVPGAGGGGITDGCTSDSDCSTCNCVRVLPVNGSSHCCSAGTIGPPGAGGGIVPGGFLDCVTNDAPGTATCATAGMSFCCNGSASGTGSQGTCPSPAQQECICNP